MEKVRKYGFGSIVLACVLALCMLTMFACGSVDVGSDPTTDGAKYSITVSDSIQNGSVDSSHGSTTAGTTITLDVSPSSGYGLSSISYNSTAITADASGAYTFTMPAENVTITAEFTKLSYDITIDSSITNGTVSIDKTSSVWDEEIIVTVSPASEYALVVGSLKYNDSLIMSSNEVYSFTMPQADVVVTAQFAKAEFIVSVTGGTLVDGTAYGSFSSGDKVQLTPTIDAGKKFEGWYEVLSDGDYKLITAEQNAEIEVTGAINIIAVYSDIVYTVSVTGGATDKASYTYGETVTITPTAVDGSQFLYWEKNDGTYQTGSSSGVYSYSVVTEGDSFTAVYQEIPGYVGAVSYTVDAFGLAGSGSYYEGDTVKITFNSNVIDYTLYPNYDSNGTMYGVSGIKLTDGTEVILDEGEIYTFTMTAGNIKLTPAYDSIEFNVTTGDHDSASGDGTFARGESVTVSYDSTVEIFTTFVGWVDVNGVIGDAGDIVSTSQTYTFDMPRGEVVLTPSEKLYSGAGLVGIDSTNNFITIDRYSSTSAYTCSAVESYEIYFYAMNTDGTMADLVLTLQYVAINNVGYLQYVDTDGTVLYQVQGFPAWNCATPGTTAFDANNGASNGTAANVYLAILMEYAIDGVTDDATEGNFNLTDKASFYLGAKLYATQESGIADSDIFMFGSFFTFQDNGARTYSWATGPNV